jgi:hypothetical protein
VLCSSSHADCKYNSGTRIELAIMLQEPWQTQMWWTKQESNKWRVEVCNHKTWATPESSTYLNRQCKHIAKATRQSSNTHNQKQSWSLQGGELQNITLVNSQVPFSILWQTVYRGTNSQNLVHVYQLVFSTVDSIQKNPISQARITLAAYKGRTLVYHLSTSRLCLLQ